MRTSANLTQILLTQQRSSIEQNTQVFSDPLTGGTITTNQGS